MKVNIERSWEKHLRHEFDKDYFIKLTDYVRNAYRERRIYPPAKEIFCAFDWSSFDATKVVILGQDPYHGPGQAHGLCFSVKKGIALPPSLRNIFKEICDDIGGPMPTHGNLEHWARQGVLLLNTTLTVEANRPGSHYGKGWQKFTDAVIRTISMHKKNVVFLLWGAHAQQKKKLIDLEQHLVLETSHPSPFSAHKGFLGSRHFSKANDYLAQHNLTPIDWLV